MFIGHFGAGFAAKSVANRVSLGTLFLAAQFIDLLWPTLLLLGLEHVTIMPGATEVTPLIFDHYPISHSMLAVFGWSILLGGAYLLLRKDKRGATILAVLVFSHWVLDLIVHQPDLPVYPGGMVLGMNVWSSLALTLLIELTLLAVGVWLYLRSTRALDAIGQWGLWGLVAFLLLINAANLFGDPPPSADAIAWVGQAQWLLVIWGYWVDKHRSAGSRELGPESGADNSIPVKR